MYRWILSLLALLGYSGMAAQAQQQASQINHTSLSHSSPVDVQQDVAISDGTTAP